MKDFKKEAEKIEFEYTPSLSSGVMKLPKEVVESLYQLHLEGVREILGEDEAEDQPFSIVTPKGGKLFENIARNQLRAEQRAKLDSKEEGK